MRLIALLLCIICPLTLQAEEKTYGSATASLVSVYDGDTIFVDICNWPEIVGSRIGVRINGIDTPERTSKDTKIKELASEARMLIVGKMREAKSLELRNMKRGKYFRIVADVYVDGVNIADVLLEKGLAKPYSGSGKRPKWTDSDYSKYFDK